MRATRRLRSTVYTWMVVAVATALLLSVSATSAQQAAPEVKSVSIVGTVKSISSDALSIANDQGVESKVQLPSGIRVYRVAPGAKDLKDATPIALSDIQEGDRILVKAKPGDSGGALQATLVVAMKKSEIADKKAHDQEEWQRHGIGGLVKKVDSASDTITIGTMSAAGAKDVAVTVSKSTILRRYAPGSVKFDDAKPSSINEINPGDQLRARGARNEDGTSFAAAEIVTGSFRNLSGTISSVDAAAGTLTLSDIISKSTVTVRVKPDTQLRKLPAQMAQMIAMRLKGAQAGSSPAPGASGAPSPTSASAPSIAPGGAPGGSPRPNAGGSGAGAGRGDMQAMLSRLPTSSLSDFSKGDVVMIVATGATGEPNPSAITILGGVEPILQASPQGQSASILTPWSLNSGGGGDTGN